MRVSICSRSLIKQIFENEIAIPVGVLSQKLGAKAPAQKKARPRSMRGGGSRLSFKNLSLM